MLKKIAATLIMALVAVLGFAIPAQAAPTCPDTLICFFDRSDWQGTMYRADPWSLPGHTCFNMSYDPNTGIQWNDIVDSVWYNESASWWNGSYAEFYEGPNCTVRAVTRAKAGQVPVYDQMQSCKEAAPWDGPCGPPNNVEKRISSWAIGKN